MNKTKLILFLIIILFIHSCKPNKEDNGNKRIDSIMENIDFNNPAIVKFNNKVFCIPSPIQISQLIKDIEIEYNKEQLNLAGNYFNYNTSYKQALNIGVYGADLAYVNLYEQYGEAKNYFLAIKKLADELGINNTFNKNFLDRIEQNNGNQDSVLYILSTIYRKTDSFLLDNNKTDTGILIIAGGWLESLYFMTNSLDVNKNEKIINRIGDQKQPLKNLLELLLPYYGKKSENFDIFVASLSDLDLILDNIKQEYVYEKSTTLKEKKLTIINSKTNYKIEEKLLEQIKIKVKEIRNNMIE